MNQNLSKWLKGLAVALVLSIGAGAGYYYFFSASAKQAQEFQHIVPFDYDRDADTIKKWFDEDWFWLIASDEYDVDGMLKYRMWGQDQRTAGQLHIYVLRENEQLQGFAAYYVESPGKGRILFILVNPESRGKRVGEKLVNFCTKQLWDLGVQQILIFTRTSNHRAQRLYLRCGYKELTRWDSYMYFIMKRPENV